MITPGSWHWWTSNSFTRLMSDDHGHTRSVLSPVVLRDGQPDIVVTPDDMALIAAAPVMLEVLQDALRECPNCKGSGRHIRGDPRITCSYCPDIRRAIQLATTVKR